MSEEASGNQKGAGDSIYASQAERERAARYSRTREWLVLISTLWSAAVSLIALTTGLSSALRRRASRVGPRRLGPVIPYTVAGAILSFLISLPLSFYQGFVIEHRYGLSNQTWRGWLLDELKGLAVGLVLGIPIVQGVYAIIRRWPFRWWALLSALTVPFSVLLANLAPVLLMPLFNKFEPLKDRALAQRIKDLAAREGVTVSEVMQMDMSKQTKKVNAMFTGLGRTKRIVLGDTLLEEFTPDEIEVVLAHELGHQVHNDIWKSIALSAPTTVVGLYAAHRLMPPIIKRFGKHWGLDTKQAIADVATLPLLTLLASGAMLAISPLLNALSRRFVEHRADRYALDLTGNRAAFISAMEKLGRMNLSNPKPAAVVKYLLYSHPPLQERIDFAQSYPGKEET